jgi:uncharacterized protein YhjY with autotransporter beta-barrel domain
LTVYPTGRFSGGSNYIDTLAQILQVPVQDFAIGGAFGGTNNGTLCFDPVYGAPMCGKGLQYEVDQFLNVGPQSNVFPNAANALTQNDLLAVSIGGNNARIYQQAGGPLASAATAGSAAAVGTAAQLGRLVAQGNPTISFLALNGAVAPEVANDPAAQQVRGVFSTAYYTSLQSTLAGYAANGSIVHYLDGQVLLQQVVANPGAYGMTKGIVCPIFPDPTCLVDSSGYLFYGDALHLTSGGFALVARYVAVQLAAPLTLEATSELGLDTARQWGRTLDSRSNGFRGAPAPGLRVYALADGFSRDAARSDQNDEFEIRGLGATIGAEYGLGTGLVGVAGNYSRPKVNFGSDTAKVRSHSWQIGAYGGIDLGGFFGQAYLGYGKDNNDLTRTGVINDMSANPNGNHTTAGLKGGYLAVIGGGVKVGPVLALDYAHAKVDGYTESGDAALTLNVGSQKAKSFAGQAGLEVRGDLSGMHPYLDLVAEHQFSDNARSISFSQTDAPIIVNTWNVSGGKQTYGRFSLGASAPVYSTIGVDVSASTTMGRDGGQEVSGRVGLNARF